jgi:hypothetical protein
MKVSLQGVYLLRARGTNIQNKIIGECERGCRGGH